jgi:hypothetical protein
MRSRILLVFLQNARKIKASKKNSIENILNMFQVSEDKHQDAIWSVKTNIKMAFDH